MSIERCAWFMGGPEHEPPKAAVPLGRSLEYARTGPRERESRRVLRWALLRLAVGAVCLALSAVAATVALPGLIELCDPKCPPQWGRPDHLDADEVMFLASVAAVSSCAVGVIVVCSSLPRLVPRRLVRWRRGRRPPEWGTW